jgi:hypothetical protein
MHGTELGYPIKTKSDLPKVLFNNKLVSKTVETHFSWKHIMMEFSDR